ncbi:hypothetical protein AB0D22_07615 [Kitasatospora sp. NPDC048538]|uniref:hypothetical protein n=1 Tax=Kitasatospora sp. NPDC048538 TaxID=3155633 RepID=UPI00340DDAD3
MDLSGIASIAALAGIPCALLAARWQTKTALARTRAQHDLAVRQHFLAAQRASYAALIAQATIFRREAWDRSQAGHIEPAAMTAAALATFEALAMVKLDAPAALLDLVEEVNGKAATLNRWMTGGGSVDDIQAACRALRDALDDLTHAARSSLRDQR